MRPSEKTFDQVAPKFREAGIPVSLSPRELAVGSGMCLTHIYDALRTGQLKGFRVGRRGWRIDSSEARRWIESLRG